jgi:hypothetical protein
MLYMVTFTINIPPMMLAYIYHTWILWVLAIFRALQYQKTAIRRATLPSMTTWGIAGKPNPLPELEMAGGVAVAAGPA